MESILNTWKNKNYKPFYWLEGDEEFFLDTLAKYAEHQIIPEAYRIFDSITLYGKDISLDTVINECRQVPMQADKRLVVIKEAQQCRDLEKLQPYFENPNPTTILIIFCKEKRIEGKKVLRNSIERKGVFFSSKKLYDSQLPTWIKNYLARNKATIDERSLYLIIEHIGNNLTRITMELQKLFINRPEGTKNITAEDIEKYIGISKQYNIFELINALSYKDLDRVFKILNYCIQNPKSMPVVALIPMLYNYYVKILLYFENQQEKVPLELANILGVHSFFLKDYEQAARRYTYEKIEKNILILHWYNLKAIGINNVSLRESELLKELFAQLLAS